jgi:hypothetical protein
MSMLKKDKEEKIEAPVAPAERVKHEAEKALERKILATQDMIKEVLRNLEELPWSRKVESIRAKLQSLHGSL